MLIKKIRNFILKEEFHPTLIGIFTNPFYFARRGLYAGIVSFSGYIKGNTLDVGCGTKPYQKVFKGIERYTGLEIDTPNNRAIKKADVYYGGRVFPFESGIFDSVVVFQVFEHIFHPEEFLKEIYRVMKQGGILLISVPFIWDEHEQPYDYARYSSYGIRFILRTHGFEIIRQRKTIPDIRAVFQLINAYLYKIAFSDNRFLNISFTLLVAAPVNIVGEIASLFLPHNSDLYLDNIIVAKKREV